MVKMQKQRAFTVIELLVVIAIIAVLVGILFPAIGAVRRRAKQSENNAQVRNILQGTIQFSESHRGFFPGFDGAEFTADTLKTTGNSGPGQTVEARYWALLNGNYSDGDALVSSVESKEPWTGGQVSTDNYSYSMLKIASNNNVDPFNGQNGSDRFRREQWRNQQNAQAPIVSDRLTKGPATVQAMSQPDQYQSIHDGSSLGNWIGSIGFGDLHVDFAKTPLQDTRFSGFLNSEATTPDDIFAQRDTGVGGQDADKNAAMVYQGFNIPVGPIQ